MNIYNDDILCLLLLSFAVGAACGVLYDLLREMRYRADVAHNAVPVRVKLIFEYISIFLTDIVFCLIFGICAVMLMYNANNGVFRGGVYISMFLGCILYRLTLSRLIRKIFFYIFKLLRGIWRRIAFVIFIPIRLILKIFHLTIGRFVCIIINRALRGIRSRRSKKSGDLALICVSSAKEGEHVDIKKAEVQKARIIIGRRNEEI